MWFVTLHHFPDASVQLANIPALWGEFLCNILVKYGDDLVYITAIELKAVLHAVLVHPYLCGLDCYAERILDAPIILVSSTYSMCLPLPSFMILPRHTVSRMHIV